MNSDGTGQRRINAEEGYGSGSTAPAWSPDGSKIAFTSANGSTVSNINVMNYDGSNQIALTNYPIDSHVYNSMGSWSPDGSKLVFSRAGAQTDIYVMNAADGGQVRRLTTSTAEDQYPDWSPDGSKILFVSNRDGNFEIYTMNPDGSGQTRLTNTAEHEHGYSSWSPDGSKIAFSLGGDTPATSGIFIMNADGTGRTQLTKTAGLNPVWSPEGDKIAFDVNTEGLSGTGLYVMDASDGSNLMKLTFEDLVNENNPDWGTQTTLPPSEQDVSPPIITVPKDMEFEAATVDGSVQIKYIVTAKDDVDGNATLNEDNTLTQDNVGGDLSIRCEPASGSMLRANSATYPVDCIATDAAGNSRSGSFNIRVRFPELAQPVLSITEKDCSRYPDIIFFRYVVEGLPRNVSDYRIFTLTANDGTETAFDKSYARGTGEAGSAGGSLAGRTERFGLGPYTVTYYEATGPDDPNDATAENIVPLPGGLQASATFTCDIMEDTTPPTLTVPENIVVEVASEQGNEVTYTVSAQDNVDGNATLEEDGTTTTQDDIGGDIDISCEPPSGSVFPVGETTVECSATDEVGNTATASFTVTVNPLTPPPQPPSCRGEAATIVGTDDDDDLAGTSNRDVIAGLGGNDDISGLGGNDLMCGGDGTDIMAGGDGNDIMAGESGNDQMAGGTGNDQLLGEGDNDSIVGGEGTDSANGGADTDTCTAETETSCES